MDIQDLLIDLCDRVEQIYHHVVADQPAAVLTHRPADDANPIGWQLWHTARIQDDHISHIAGWEQLYVAGGWAERFGLPPDTDDIGYGHTPEQVAAVPADRGADLLAYLDEVAERSKGYLATVDADELDRIIDTSFDPPVSVGVRLVSMFCDHLMHAGQADYVRGLAEHAGDR